MMSSESYTVDLKLPQLLLTLVNRLYLPNGSNDDSLIYDLIKTVKKIQNSISINYQPNCSSIKEEIICETLQICQELIYAMKFLERASKKAGKNFQFSTSDLEDLAEITEVLDELADKLDECSRSENNHNCTTSTHSETPVTKPEHEAKPAEQLGFSDLIEHIKKLDLCSTRLEQDRKFAMGPYLQPTQINKLKINLNVLREGIKKAKQSIIESIMTIYALRSEHEATRSEVLYTIIRNIKETTAENSASLQFLDAISKNTKDFGSNERWFYELLCLLDISDEQIQSRVISLSSHNSVKSVGNCEHKSERSEPSNIFSGNERIDERF